MGKSTISTGHFNSYVSLPEGKTMLKQGHPWTTVVVYVRTSQTRGGADLQSGSWGAAFWKGVSCWNPMAEPWQIPWLIAGSVGIHIPDLPDLSMI